jgi:hypothetical protein
MRRTTCILAGLDAGPSQRRYPDAVQLNRGTPDNLA